MSEIKSKNDAKTATKSPSKHDLLKRRKGDKNLPADTHCHISFYPEEDTKIEDNQMINFNGRFDEKVKCSGDNKKEIKMKPIYSFKNVEAYTAALYQLDTEVFNVGFKPRMKAMYLQMLLKDQAKCIFGNIIPAAKTSVAEHLLLEIEKNEKELKCYENMDEDAFTQENELIYNKLKAEEQQLMDDCIHFQTDTSQELKCLESVSDDTHNYFYKMILRHLQKKVFVDCANALVNQKSYMQTEICKVTQWTALENAERLRTINTKLIYFPKYDMLGGFSNLELKHIYYKLLPAPWQAQIRVNHIQFMDDHTSFEDVIEYAIVLEQNEKQAKTTDEVNKQRLKKKSNNNSNNKNVRFKFTSKKTRSDKFCSYCKENGNKFFYNHNTDECGIKKRAEGTNKSTNNNRKRSSEMLYVSRQELDKRDTKLKSEIIKSFKRIKNDKNESSSSDSE